jgi:sigma-B regulation protein RsbU (phosphoserine phosphatase)
MGNESKILLVDDDATARTIPALFLRKWGYEVIEASDGEQALNILEREPIGLVISDWIMPKLSGIELCRKVRERQADRYTYLILCTSKGEKADLIEGMDAGADDFLVKPLSKEEMRVRIRAGQRVLELERGLAEGNRRLRGINGQLQTAYERIEGDLKAAAWMQTALLPPPSPKTLNVAAEWLFRPSSYVAGDIFNLFPVDEHRIGFYLLDVSGHGVPAAMLSVTLSFVLSAESAHGSTGKRGNAGNGSHGGLSPADVVYDLNQRFQSKDDRYFTMIYGLLDSRSGEVTLTQAGHPNPFLLRRGCDPEAIGEGGPPVGLWPDIEYETVGARLCPGDRLILYSDGVIECANPEGAQFGEQRLMELLKNADGKPLSEVLVGLEAAMEEWRGSNQFDDDVSVLALEMTEARQEQA